MKLVYKRTDSLKDMPTPYCAGCYHALAQKLIAEVVDEMNIREEAVFAASVGCNGMGQFLINYDGFGSQHGRAAAAAAAFKAVNPDSTLIVYQGDGDAASIGLAETVHAARRGEPITVIFANNTLYGMTGGQMAPTTMLGQKVTTAESNPYPPMHVPELIATLDAPDYVARCSIHDPKHIRQFKKALKHALTRQKERNAYSFIEVLCACPTSGKIKPSDSPRYMEDIMTKVFPLGEWKRDGERV